MCLVYLPNLALLKFGTIVDEANGDYIPTQTYRK